MSQMSNIYEFSNRIKQLPPYLFVEIDKMKKKAMEKGVDIINLGVGDPDLPPDERVKNKMIKALDGFENHQYPLDKGKEKFREEIQRFLKKRYKLDFDSDTQIQPLIGSKEGLAHFPLAFVEPGDVVLVPEPAYPVYNSATIFAGGKPSFISLKAENNFLPDWNSISDEVFKSARILFLNYPNNPTGAMATKSFFEDTVKLAKKYNIIVVHDAAYNDLFFDQPPLSFFEVEGALDVGIEFHSLSKPFSMTGWRIGWACGNEELISGLAKVKNNIDSGVFGAIQDAGIEALENYDNIAKKNCAVYHKRMGIMAKSLENAGWELTAPDATFYIWAKPPVKTPSIDAVKKLIEEAGIVCTPGSGFGPSGEGYVRFALTKNIERLEEAVKRIKEIKW